MLLVSISRKLTKEEADRRGYESTTIMGYSLRTGRYRYTMWVHDFTTRQLFLVIEKYVKKNFMTTKKTR